MASVESTAKHPAAAGEERPLKRCRHASVEERPLKRCRHASVEERPLKPRAAKRKAEADDDELLAAKKKAFYAKSGPSRKMTRLPRAEVASILSSRTHPDRAPSYYKALKLQNPDLIPSPEEETDELKVAEYADARDFYEAAEEFAVFQAWVRSEYTKNGSTTTTSLTGNRSELGATVHGRLRSKRWTSLMETKISRCFLGTDGTD